MKKTLFFLSMASLFPLAGLADPPALPGDPGGTPIDGISLLVAAGVGYGAKKLHDRRKKRIVPPSDNPKEK